MSASPNRPLVSALFGAAATFIALTGAVAIADTPRQLSDVMHVLATTEVFEITPVTHDVEPQIQALTPAAGTYDEPALQVTYDVYA
jgi:hypothetical protein